VKALDLEHEPGVLVGRVDVLSPHPDDAALALGAAIARAVMKGAHVTVVTPFAGDPASEAPAGWWDRARGFETQGEAARRRRDEDTKACSFLGARPVWLPFPDAQYGVTPDEDAVWAALEPHLRGDVLLLPGFPLKHPDHAWLTGLVLDHVPADWRVGFYLERPYARPRQLDRGRGAVQARLGRPLRWLRLRATREDLRTKGRACRAYRSQFGLVGASLPTHVAFPELWSPPECLAWLDEA
jgi:LmbE family N-acetylglucosaminyl deacetylase